MKKDGGRPKVKVGMNMLLQMILLSFILKLGYKTFTKIVSAVGMFLALLKLQNQDLTILSLNT